MTNSRWRTAFVVVFAGVLVVAQSTFFPPNLKVVIDPPSLSVVAGESASISFTATADAGEILLDVGFEGEPGFSVEPQGCRANGQVKVICSFDITAAQDTMPGSYELDYLAAADAFDDEVFLIRFIPVEVLRPDDQPATSDAAPSTTTGEVAPTTSTTVELLDPTCAAGDFTVLLDPAVVTAFANGFGSVVVQVDGSLAGEIRITLEGDTQVLDVALTNLQPLLGQNWDLFIDRTTGDFPQGEFDMAVHVATDTGECSAPFLFVVVEYEGEG